MSFWHLIFSSNPTVDSFHFGAAVKFRIFSFFIINAQALASPTILCRNSFQVQFVIKTIFEIAMANLIKINVDTKYTYGTILKFLIYIYSLQMMKN